MKRTKKFLSLILSVVLLLTLAMPVMATENLENTGGNSDGSYKIEIKDIYDGHTYEAYQIFDGDYNDSTKILTNIKWGSGFKKENTHKFLEALQNPENGFGTVFADIEHKHDENDNLINPDEVAREIASIIEKLELAHDSSLMKAFAKVLHTKDSNGDYTYLEIKEAKKSNEIVTSEIVNNVTEYTYTIEGINSGYYLIKDQDRSLEINPEENPDEIEYDYYTRLMLYVVDNITVRPKGGVPKVSKSVGTSADNSYKEAITAAMSDAVYFRLEGTLPSTLGDYTTYKYQFVDKLSPGLDLLYEETLVSAIVKSVVLHENGETAFNLGEMIENGQATIEYNTAGNNEDRTLTITFNNLKASFPNLLTTDKIVIIYRTKLNENAIHGTGTEAENKEITENEVKMGDSGNENKVYLVFSNDPQGDGTGQTPEDDARVYTFQLNIRKEDQSKNSLAGAKFLLYHRVNEKEKTDALDYYYAVFEDKGNGNYVIKSWILMDEKIVSLDADGNPLGAAGTKIYPKTDIYNWPVSIDNMMLVSFDEEGTEDEKINVQGLAASKYFLSEIVNPQDYNKLDEDVEVTLVANMGEHKEYLTSLTVFFGGEKIGDVTNGLGEGTITNYKGSVLPSTGGTGRTFLYVGGAAFATIAVVLLVTKKRMKSER